VRWFAGFTVVIALAAPSGGEAAGLPQASCLLSSFDGIRTLATRAAAAGDAAADVAWSQASRAVSAVLGVDAPADRDLALRRSLVAPPGGDPVVFPCTAGAGARDRLAYKLNLLGYSLDDIALIIGGSASRAAVDQDAARKLAGLPPAPPASRAQVFPAAQAGPALAGQAGPASAVQGPAPSVIDWWTRYYSSAYGVDYRLVAAVMQRESGGNPAAVSPKGAVGLMQLMPATAAMLRVNPRDPLDNLRGGIAYLAGLIGSYRDVRAALIAYNAGPSHANQVARGERELFPETRRYLSAVDALYPLDLRR